MSNKETYILLDSCKSLSEASLKIFNVNNYRTCEKIKKISESVEFNWNVYKERRLIDKIRICLNCGKEYKTKEQNSKFCSHSCSAISSNKSKKTVKKPRKRYIRKKKDKICKICGKINCNKKEPCNKMYSSFNSLICFGFDIKSLGTQNVFKEYEKVKKILIEEYLINELSPKDIKIKYSYTKTSENLLILIKTFGINMRTQSESIINSVLQGKHEKKVINKNSFVYHHGWHTTWDNKKVYYRSSYELDFCKELDEKKIAYEMESLRIKYFDSKLNKYRGACPDFLLVDTNEIIEVKSKYTLEKDNMIDKFKQYENLGYIPKLLYEHKMYTFEEFVKYI